MANIKDFKEVLALLPHERPDVRKQVLKVVTDFMQHAEIIEYFIDNCAHETKLISEMVQPGDAAKSYISQVLVLLINIADKGACSRAMLDSRLIQRLMLLLEKGGLSSGVQELALILINNLTSVSVHAVEALLQIENKTLEGYYLSQLVRRFVDEHQDASTLLVKPSEDDGAVGGGRDRSKWVGAILGNCAQCAKGRELLLDDDENIEKYAALLQNKDPQLRMAVACLLKNLLHDPETHAKTIEHGAGEAILSRVVNEEEKVPEILELLCSSIKCYSLSPDGTNYLDGAGAKKHLQELLPKLDAKGAAHELLAEVAEKLDDIQEIVGIEDPAAPGAEPEKTPEEILAEKRKNVYIPEHLRKPVPEESGVEELPDSDEEQDEPEPVSDEQAAAEDEMADIE